MTIFSFILFRYFLFASRQHFVFLAHGMDTNHSFLTSFFQQYTFEYDDRKPDFFVSIPKVGSVGFTNLSLIFWVQTFILLSMQSLMNAVVALFVYRFVVKPRKRGKGENYRLTFMIGYGFIVPTLVWAPLALLDVLQLKNTTLMVCMCGAIPNLLLLRVIEAMVSSK